MLLLFACKYHNKVMANHCKTFSMPFRKDASAPYNTLTASRNVIVIVVGILFLRASFIFCCSLHICYCCCLMLFSLHSGSIRFFLLPNKTKRNNYSIHLFSTSENEMEWNLVVHCWENLTHKAMSIYVFILVQTLTNSILLCTHF